MRVALIASTAIILAATGCKTTNSASVAKDDAVPATADAGAAGAAQAGDAPEDPYAEGFAIERPKACNCPADGTSWADDTWPFAFADEHGNYVPDENATAFALDQGIADDGKIVFKWPKGSETINRDYDRLSVLMKEYAELVGTCLHKDPVGAGEEAWTSWLRSSQREKLDAVSGAGQSVPWCQEVVRQLVDRYVPTGSRYRQYGNCGEGGRVGACLAKRAGFRDDEIRVCLSKNDHFFGMVYRGVEEGVDKKWCILDRWDLVGNFSCGVDIDFAQREITKDGRITGQQWFKKVNCTTLDKFMEDPNNLYNF